jgi:putative ABC transport system permease protein
MIRQLPFHYAYRNLGRNRLRLVASLLGPALVVLLVLAAGGFVRGMQASLTQHSGLHENILLLSTGSEESLERSQIDAVVEGVAAASIPGVKQAAGVLFVSPEINASLPWRESEGSELDLSAVVRGVRPVALLVHPEVEIVAGRFPETGRDEIMVGALASTRLGLPEERLAIGRTLRFDNRDWTIVGRFSAPTTVMDAEIWMNLADLQVATKRESTLSCVVLTLDGGSFGDADFFAKNRLDLEITAMREADYYRDLAAFYRPIRIMIIATAMLIALGGVLGGLNTMYASFASRVREIGMLQSVGFTRRAIVANLTEESLFAAACGSIIGSAAGLVLLDGVAVRFSMGAFELILDAPVVLAGMVGGLLVGLIGAVPPAIRCLRLPIPEALKSF